MGLVQLAQALGARAEIEGDLARLARGGSAQGRAGRLVFQAHDHAAEKVVTCAAWRGEVLFERPQVGRRWMPLRGHGAKEPEQLASLARPRLFRSEGSNVRCLARRSAV